MQTCKSCGGPLNYQARVPKGQPNEGRWYVKCTKCTNSYMFFDMIVEDSGYVPPSTPNQVIMPHQIPKLDNNADKKRKIDEITIINNPTPQKQTSSATSTTATASSIQTHNPMMYNFQMIVHDKIELLQYKMNEMDAKQEAVMYYLKMISDTVAILNTEAFKTLLLGGLSKVEEAKANNNPPIIKTQNHIEMSKK